MLERLDFAIVERDDRECRTTERLCPDRRLRTLRCDRRLRAPRCDIACRDRMECDDRKDRPMLRDPMLREPMLRDPMLRDPMLCEPMLRIGALRACDPIERPPP
jgi:hypothetical protein